MTEHASLVAEPFPDGLVTSTSERVDALLAELSDPEPDINDIGDRMLELIARVPEAASYLIEKEDELRTLLAAAQIGMAGIMGKMFAACVLLYAPAEEQPSPNIRFAHEGPAAEIALAALHLLRYAGDVVPLDVGDGPLDEAENPDFADYPRIFRTAVDHVANAAYYLLDPEQSRAALLSSPPEIETFPPLPFPRVWVEMTHLTPLLRLAGGMEDKARHIDLLGVAIAEIEQGRVWDVYMPFQFNDASEFFFVAGRIGPNTVIAHDSAFEFGDLTFAEVRRLAVGVTHLITARNAPPQLVTLPRPQRRQLAREGQADPSSRLYYVDLHDAGERASTATGRQYHVRWLVRGHWRHVAAGRTFCTCCDPPQIASWVAPYIKGLPGAPWKGHQVRRHQLVTARAE